MGVDVRLWLPADCRVKDVAIVAAALVGIRLHRKALPGGGWYADAVNDKAITAKACGSPLIPEMCSVIIKPEKGQMLIGRLYDGPVSFNYHFESTCGERYVSMRSYPEHIALMVGIAKFFGGRVDFNDCDDNDANVRFRKHGPNDPEDGDAWHRQQNRILAVKPIDDKEIGHYRRFANYQ